MWMSFKSSLPNFKDIFIRPMFCSLLSFQLRRLKMWATLGYIFSIILTISGLLTSLPEHLSHCLHSYHRFPSLRLHILSVFSLRIQSSIQLPTEPACPEQTAIPSFKLPWFCLNIPCIYNTAFSSQSANPTVYIKSHPNASFSSKLSYQAESLFFPGLS